MITCKLFNITFCFYRKHCGLLPPDMHSTFTNKVTEPTNTPDGGRTLLFCWMHPGRLRWLIHFSALQKSQPELDVRTKIDNNSSSKKTHVSCIKITSRATSVYWRKDICCVGFHRTRTESKEADIVYLKLDLKFINLQFPSQNCTDFVAII